VDHGEGTSSRFKKKKENDKRCRDDNFVAAVERNTSRPKSIVQGPLREAPVRVVPAPRDPRQAHAQGVPTHEELRQRHPQVKNDGPAQEGRATPDNDNGTGVAYPGEGSAVYMILGGGISGKTLEAVREAHPTRSFQRRRREVVLSKVVGGSDNLRRGGPSRPRTSAWILPTSGIPPIQIQKGPQGLDGWGKWDQHALCVYA
jgi:hypothetical protein